MGRVKAGGEVLSWEGGAELGAGLGMVWKG